MLSSYITYFELCALLMEASQHMLFQELNLRLDIYLKYLPVVRIKVTTVKLQHFLSLSSFGIYCLS